MYLNYATNIMCMSISISDEPENIISELVARTDEPGSNISFSLKLTKRIEDAIKSVQNPGQMGNWGIPENYEAAMRKAGEFEYWIEDVTPSQDLYLDEIQKSNDQKSKYMEYLRNDVARLYEYFDGEIIIHEVF